MLLLMQSDTARHMLCEQSVILQLQGTHMHDLLQPYYLQHTSTRVVQTVLR